MKTTTQKTAPRTNPVMFDLLLRAAVFGKLAFHKGLKAPAQDADYMPLLRGRTWKEGIAIADAWLKAWQREQLISVGILVAEPA